MSTAKTLSPNVAVSCLGGPSCDVGSFSNLFPLNTKIVFPNKTCRILFTAWVSRLYILHSHRKSHPPSYSPLPFRVYNFTYLRLPHYRST